ncbi:MAG: prolipoprotein diacylglyceryl transferase [Christensenellaceae bacterium]|nr:prolipoprotein diacylglyceryl transferase [Christensenellaceae bacterium]
MHWTGKIQRVAFHLGSIEVAWYGIIITLAMFIGLFLAWFRGRKAGIKSDEWLEVFIITIPLAIIFARAGYVLVRPSEYFESPITWESVYRWINIREGGITITTAIIGGALGIFLWSRIRKVDFIGIADSAMPTILFAQAFGRWANFFNQEIYGAAVTNSKLQFFPYSVFIADKNGFFQASFFYESMMNLAMGIIVLVLLKRIRLKGAGILSYLIGYGIVRFFMEFLRDDGAEYEKFEFLQVILAVLIVACIGLFVYLVYIQRKKGERVWFPRGVPGDQVLQLKRYAPKKETQSGAENDKSEEAKFHVDVSVTTHSYENRKPRFQRKHPPIPFNKSKKKHKH